MVVSAAEPSVVSRGSVPCGCPRGRSTPPGRCWAARSWVRAGVLVTGVKRESIAVSEPVQPDDLAGNRLNGSRPAAGAPAHSGTLAVKCPKCRELLLAKDLEKHLKVCPRCQYHFRMAARERIDLLL